MRKDIVRVARCVEIASVLIAMSLLIGSCGGSEDSSSNDGRNTSATRENDVTAPEIAKRVNFSPGNNSATLEGSVIRGERDEYLLDARAGQQMNVSISSFEDNAVFQIFEPGGNQALPGAGERDDALEWSGELPASGDYTIVVGGTRGNAAYTLRVTIE